MQENANYEHPYWPTIVILTPTLPPTTLDIQYNVIIYGVLYTAIMKMARVKEEIRPSISEMSEEEKTVDISES